ncbi:MAG: lipopolysaccharide assembly protein LapA domain-containing protein [Candidatus Neomarinimicrobiota bacterium]
MRLLKIFIGLLIVLALAIFLSSNSDQYSTIWLFPGKTLPDINLAYILVTTLALGIVLGFGIGLVQIVSQHQAIREQNRQLKKLRTELNNLRHSALDEDIFKGERESAAAAKQAASSADEQPA